MAKNEPKVQAPKNKKPRTAYQIARDKAKRERNIRAAEWRLDRLRETQRWASELRREHGYMGNDEEVIETHRLVTQMVADLEKQRREQEERETEQALRRAYVEEALNGPSAWHLKRWLHERPATYERVVRFFVKSGLPRVAPESEPAKVA